MTCLLFLLEILEEGRDVLVPLVDRPVARAITRQRLQRLDHRRGRPPVVGAGDRARGRILIINESQLGIPFQSINDNYLQLKTVST